MKLNKVIVLCWLISIIICVSIIPSISADIIMPGTKSSTYRYEIENMNEYSDYVFIRCDLYAPWGEPVLLTIGESFSFYKLSTPSIFAVKEEDFNESDLQKDINEQWEYFEDNPKVIQSNIELEPVFTNLPANEPLESSYIYLEIISIDDASLQIKKDRVVYTYNDGTSEEKYFNSQDTMPERSKKALLPFWFESFWYFWIPLIAIICILIILFVRKRDKKQ